MIDDPSFDEEFNAELQKIFAEPATPPRPDLDLTTAGPERVWSASADRVSLRDRLLGEPSGLPRSKTPFAVAAFVIVVLVLGVLGVRKNTVPAPVEVGTDAIASASLPGTSTTVGPRSTLPGSEVPLPPAPVPAGPTGKPGGTAVATTRPPAVTVPPTRATTTTTHRPVTTTPETTAPESTSTTSSSIVNPFAPPTTEPHEMVVKFLYDFADETVDQPPSPARWTVEKGTWTIRAGGDGRVLRTDGPVGETATAVTGGDDWTAYRVDARLRIEPDASMGIAAMYHGENDNYQCQVDRAAGRLKLFKAVSPFGPVVVGDEAYIVPADGVVHLVMSVVGGQVTCQGTDDPNAPPLVFADRKWTAGKLAVVAHGAGEVQRLEVRV